MKPVSITPLLAFQDVSIDYGPFRAVDGVTLALRPGETLGLAGESGSGKSTLGRAALRLSPLAAGAIYMEGERISGPIPRDRARKLPGRLQMIFQDPMASLNERAKVEYIVTEGLMNGPRRLSARERRAVGLKALEAVGLDGAMMDRFPHEFSGGQRQRIGIARALVMDPACIIADEPVSALDVSARAEVLNLMAQLKRQRNMGYLFISHDLALMGYFCDRIAVLCRGRLVELAPAEALFTKPAHAYTRALLAAAPLPDPDAPRTAAPAWKPPKGNAPLRQIAPGHFVRIDGEG